MIGSEGMEVDLTQEMSKNWSFFAGIEHKREELELAAPACIVRMENATWKDAPTLWSISEVRFEKVCYALLLRNYLHMSYPREVEDDPWSITDKAANRALSYEKQLASTAVYCDAPELGAQAAHIMADWKKLCEMLRRECEGLIAVMNDPAVRIWSKLESSLNRLQLAIAAMTLELKRKWPD